MDLKITFLGAAKNVTGSCYLLTLDSRRILVDCGLYQERQYRERNWNDFPVPPAEIDAIILTHAHLDHCGLLPKLVRDGFHGPVYCTPATREIAAIALLDSAELQVEDAAFKKKRHAKEKRQCPHPEIPLYTPEDVRACLPLFSTIEYRKKFSPGAGIEAIFYNAGHILGSSTVRLKFQQGEESRSILFSGDLGREESPILKDPATIDKADYVVVESTYGNRLHDSREDAIKKMAEVINRTERAGGNIVIPTFAIERAQDLLYYLNDLLKQNLIPHLAVFLDSPMAVKVTEVFREHPELYDAEMTHRMKEDESFFSLSKLYFVETVDASKAINHIKGSVIIMAGSGMLTGGRIKHHLVANITRKESAILFVSYQAQGTLGRQIVEGLKKVRILGKEYPVRAKIVQIDGLSSHADKADLIRWLSALKSQPRRVFVTHGEPEAADALAAELKNKLGWDCMVPDYLNQVRLD